MDTQKLRNHTHRLITAADNLSLEHNEIARGFFSEIKQFFKDYGGKDNSFLEAMNRFNPFFAKGIEIRDYAKYQLIAFQEYVGNNLLYGISPERQAQIDVVSYFLEQAQNILQNKDMHPATPAMIIGSVLEEFLRNWIENNNLNLGNKKPGIENYGHLLKENEYIDKQDMKDITSWAGIRNDAAHGYWEKVDDRNKIELMLQGVNLFIRQHTQKS